jgi:hypothetical protein
MGILGFIGYLLYEYFTRYFVNVKVNHLYFILSGPILLLAMVVIILLDISDKTIISFDGRKKK